MNKTEPTATLTNNGATCRTCRHMRILVGTDKEFTYQCVANPPIPVAAAQIGPRGEVRWIANAFFPPLGDPDAIWCGKWTAREPH